MTGGGGVRWLDLPSLTAASIADLAGALGAVPAPIRPGQEWAYTVTGPNHGGPDDWREAARLTGRDVLVRMACQSYLAEMENPPRGKASGAALTAVALVLGLND